MVSLSTDLPTVTLVYRVLTHTQCPILESVVLQGFITWPLTFREHHPDGVIGIFQLHNPSGRTMALGSTEPLTEMSIRLHSAQHTDIV